MSGEMRFDGSVAVITGAGGGLGRAHALLLASRGASIVVNDAGVAPSGTATTASPAEAVAAEINASGGAAVANNTRVGSQESAEAIVATALDTFGRIDILINNAGIVRDAAFHNMSAEDIATVMDVHLLGSTHLCRAIWPHMRDQRSGKIVNTTSNVGLLGNFGQANYAAAKAGLVGLTRALAIEGRRPNIQVNALAPAAVTRITPEGMIDFELAPEQVSPSVAWLVHPSCEVSGEIISAGGGRTARYFIGLTRGYWDSDPSPESIRDHFSSIVAERDYLVADGPQAEIELIRAAVATPGPWH